MRSTMMQQLQSASGKAAAHAPAMVPKGGAVVVERGISCSHSSHSAAPLASSVQQACQQARSVACASSWPSRVSCAQPEPTATAQQAMSRRRSRRRVACAVLPPSAPAAPAGELASVPSTSSGKLISKTEVAAFIQRDDLMDQMYRWAIIEAAEGGVRNFGLPMNVSPFYLAAANTADGVPMLWGFRLNIFKEGTLVCEMGIMFDSDDVSKHEYVGRGDDGFPVLEGRVNLVRGKYFEIWKLCARPVDEQLRSAIRAFCMGLVTALNRYYAFGSVFVDDAQ